MSVSPVDLIAAQLRASSPNSDWISHGVDRARELAAMFIRVGANDLQTLALESVDIWECFKLVGFPHEPTSQSEYDNLPAYTPPGMQTLDHLYIDPAFETNQYLTLVLSGNSFYDSFTGNKRKPEEVLALRDYLPLRFNIGGKPVGFIGDTNRDGSITGGAPLLRLWNDAVLVGWSSRGSGNVHYLMFLTPEKTFRFHPVWQSSRAGDRATVRELVVAAVLIGSLGYAFAGAGSLGSALGEQIVGAQFAASYPGVTSAIGNTALSTAMNGGDVEAAVKGAVVSYGAGAIGVQVGTQVAQVTDIEAIGRIAQAATTAYIRGGDVPGAVRYALLQSIPDAFPVAPSLTFEEPNMNLSISNWPDANDWQVATDPWGVSSLPGAVPPAWEAAPMPSMLDYVQPAEEPIGGGGGGFWQTSRDWAGSVFNRENVRAARDVITDVAAIVGTVRAIENPPQPGQPTPRAAVQNPNQVIRNPNGSVTVAAPDGSVRVISADEVRRASGAAGLQISPTMLAVGGAALVAVFLLARKR